MFKTMFFAFGVLFSLSVGAPRSLRTSVVFMALRAASTKFDDYRLLNSQIPPYPSVLCFTKHVRRCDGIDKKNEFERLERDFSHSDF